jgi:putative oxidoreductase
MYAGGRIYRSGSLSAGLLLIRLMLATVFIFHGAQILFGVFGGPGPAGFAGAMHLSLLQARLVGISELCGGLSMCLGFLVPLGALAIVVPMVGAIYLVHWPHGLSVTQGGMEFALSMAIFAIGIALTGPGDYSLDAFLFGQQRPSLLNSSRVP